MIVTKTPIELGDKHADQETDKRLFDNDPDDQSGDHRDDFVGGPKQNMHRLVQAGWNLYLLHEGSSFFKNKAIKTTRFTISTPIRHGFCCLKWIFLKKELDKKKRGSELKQPETPLSSLTDAQPLQQPPPRSTIACLYTASDLTDESD